MIKPNKILQQLKKLFMPKEGRTIDMTINGAWGRSIHLKDNETDVYGWLSPLPKRNDIILFTMKSGKTGKYIFTEVRPCGDPPDMFFGKVKCVGYVDMPLPLTATKLSPFNNLNL